MSERDGTEKFGVSKSTINRKKNGKNMLAVDHPNVFGPENEKTLVYGIITAGKWGFLLTSYKVRLLAKNDMDKIGIVEKRFKNNMPGVDWCKSFIMHYNELSTVTY